MLINAWISENVLQAICRTFLHSLWQGIFAALLAGMILLLTKRSSARLRYNLLGAALLLFLAGTGITFWLEMQSAPEPVPAAFIAAAPAAAYIFAPQPDLLARCLQFIDAHTTQIMMAWALIFLLKCVRISAGFYHIFRIRRSNTVQPPGEWTVKLRQLALSLGICTPVCLLECAKVQMPFTIGWLKPCIYLPAGLLAQLPADQLEAILLHELAHIRRRDYLVNILQRFTETVFFFNPALLWISALIREEREACCDDIAVAHTPRQSSYLQALVAFEHAGLQQLQLGMSLGRKRFYLLDRVKRILTNENKKLTIMEKGILLLGLAGITAFGFVPAGNEQPVVQQEPPAPREIRVEVVKDTTVKPFRLEKVKKVSTKALKLKLKSDSVKVYKLKKKDSVHVISFRDSVYQTLMRQQMKKRGKDSQYIAKLYYKIATDTTRFKMKGQVQYVTADSIYRVQPFNKKKFHDSAYIMAYRNVMENKKIKKLNADSLLLLYKPQRTDSINRKKLLFIVDPLQKKIKALPEHKRLKAPKASPGNTMKLSPIPQIVFSAQTNMVYRQASAPQVIRFESEPVLYLNEPTEVEVLPITGEPQKKPKPAPAKIKAEREVKKEPAKIKWHPPKHYKPTFREKAAQSLPEELQKRLLPPVADC
ncbi:M56 family metallopeptidase [Chitinophaga sp. GCM10012297]|uniref:M56 family metallopeptidase n=1 Tax=Chitinophaga chungangae TaxID=2821488 RepID=A0ABS3Y808_9BACT|nr:M56 family metallopeptidase [Chitinophaga chungangae]MBO9150810.1 M56 family metallopeptidase [Chitinophaga chungangae]